MSIKVNSYRLTSCFVASAFIMLCTLSFAETDNGSYWSITNDRWILKVSAPSFIIQGRFEIAVSLQSSSEADYSVLLLMSPKNDQALREPISRFHLSKHGCSSLNVADNTYGHIRRGDLIQYAIEICPSSGSCYRTPFRDIEFWLDDILKINLPLLLFTQGATSLSSNATDVLNITSEVLKRFPNTQLVLVATCESNNRPVSKRLIQKRFDNITDYLVRHTGISSQQILIRFIDPDDVLQMCYRPPFNSVDLRFEELPASGKSRKND